VPLSNEEGLRLLDTALGVGDPMLVPVRLDRSALRVAADADLLPPILRGLVRAPTRRFREGAGSLARRLEGVPAGDRERFVVELVRSHAASVLGHPSPASVNAERAFNELGFDSLGAVELRNRLAHASGLRLPATLLFDHPTPRAVAELLLSRVGGI